MRPGPSQVEAISLEFNQRRAVYPARWPHQVSAQRPVVSNPDAISKLCRGVVPGHGRPL